MKNRFHSDIIKCADTIMLLTVCVCIILLLPACTPKADEPFDAEETLTKLLTEVHYTADLEAAGEYAAYVFTDMPDGAEVKMYTCGGGHADAVIMCRARHASDVQAIRDSIQGYIGSRRHDAERYDPGEVSKYDNAIWLERDLYVIVCITSDVSGADTILK
ncbi:MAG: DUF4358 domain-containing protein [Clostridia bacterium]|nr:DUF4358 domain-containing protein [Clostridia bacterium]